jgi:hypothetical protein
LAGISCVISSAITLVVSCSIFTPPRSPTTISQIFFPRSIEGEIAARDATRDKRTQHSTAQAELHETQLSSTSVGRPSVSSPPYGKYTASVVSHEVYESPSILPPSKPIWKKPATDEGHPSKGDGSALGHPVRHQMRSDEGGGKVALSDGNVRKLRKARSKINPFVHKFTSPIGKFVLSLSRIDVP